MRGTQEKIRQGKRSKTFGKNLKANPTLEAVMSRIRAKKIKLIITRTDFYQLLIMQM